MVFSHLQETAELPGALQFPSFVVQLDILSASVKVSRWATRSAWRVLTTGVIEQHNVVQGNVALSLLGNGRFKDDLWR